MRTIFNVLTRSTFTLNYICEEKAFRPLLTVHRLNVSDKKKELCIRSFFIEFKYTGDFYNYFEKVISEK